MKTGLIIGISVLLLVIILAVFYFVHKGSSAAAAAASVSPTASSSSSPAPAGCTSYSTDQQKRDIQKLRAKCEPKLIIPIVGIGAYTKCMGEGKSKLPPIC